MSGSTKNKGKKAVAAEKLAAGAQKHLASGASLTIAGRSYTPAQVIGLLQTITTLRDAVETARTNLATQVAEEKTQLPALYAFCAELTAYVRGTFGAKPDILADFGLAPRKSRTPLTAEQQAAAKAKRAATRKARGTMGKKEMWSANPRVESADVLELRALA
jgi:hypothetical protein